MQKLLRKRLVGIGLVVALLAFAVPALAQNEWTKQTTPDPFPTPVTAMTVQPGGAVVEAGTYGGGATGHGTAGLSYFSTDFGANFESASSPRSALPGDDYTSVIWDGTGYWYTGAWNTGLWQWHTGDGFYNATQGIPWINQHVSSIAVDPTTSPHTVYFSTWGGGIYSYNYDATPVPTDFAQIPNYPTAPAALFIHQIAVVPATGGTPLTIYAATDGYGLMKGELNSGTWSWTQVFTDDMYVYSVAYNGSDLLVGTKSSGIYWSGDGGSTWTASAASVVPITTPVTDIVLSSGPNMYFASTEGQGVYRYDSYLNAWYPINDGYGSGDLIGSAKYVNALAYDSINGYLYAGTGNTALTGSTGAVYAIHLVAPAVSFTGSPFTYTVNQAYSANAHVTDNHAPADWSAYVSSGQLPPGLQLSVDNTSGYPPVITVAGTPSTDGCYHPHINVYDALLNRADVTPGYTVNPDVSFLANPNPAKLGTVQAFQSTVNGATGSLTYNWDFDSTGVQVAAGTWVSHDANPTWIYPNANTYVVSLQVIDSSPAGDGSCGSVSTTITNTVVVFAQLSVQPSVSQVGSGAQFQFFANASGGDQTCAVPPADPFTYSWEIKDANTGTVLFTSTDKNPVFTFAYTGDFIGTVTVTDCSGVSQSGSCSLNYNGPMSGTLASLTNPAPTNIAVNFNATAQSNTSGATYACTFDFGNGTIVGPIPYVPPPPPAPPYPAHWSLGNPYSTPGTYTVKATITDGLGHTTVVSMQQEIYAQFTGITASFNPDPLGAPCQFTSDQTMSMTLQPVGGLKSYRYSIDWGDGVVTTQDFNDNNPHTFTHNYAAGGSYTIKYYVTDSGNVTVTQNGSYGAFSVVAPMTSTTLTANGMSCLNPQLVTDASGNANITLLATPDAGSGNYVYDWDYTNNGTYDNTTTTPTNSVTVPYSIPSGQDSAQYTAKVRVTDVGACAAPVVTKTVTFTLFRPLAVVGTPTWSQACGSQVVSFDATGDIEGGIGPYTYLWNFDDGTTQTTATPMVSHDFATTTGTSGYDVQLTVTDSATPNCVDPPNTVNTTWHIQVVDPIIVTATATPMSGCSPLTVDFSSVGTSGGGFPGTDLSYSWDFGDGSGTSTSANPTYTYNTPGNYTATLTVTSNVVGAYSCSYQIPTQIQVFGGLTGIDFTQTETSGYLPLPDTFTTTFTDDNAGPVTLTYDWGDGTPNTVVNNAMSPDITTHTFEIHGAHTVTVTASSTCGSPMSKSRVIQVLEPSALDVTTTTLVNGVAGNAGTLPLTVSFGCVPTGGVSPYTFYWNFGDGATSLDQNPTHTYNTAGTYDAYVTVTDNWPAADGGPKTKTAHVTIIVYDPISATATADVTSGGVPLDVNFTAGATGGNGTYTYAWNFGDGGTSALQNPSHTYNTAGTYYAYVTVTDSATNSATSNNVVIHAYNPMTVTLSGTPNQGTAPLSVAFTALATGGDGNYTYKWDFNGDGVVDQTTTQGTVNHVYTAAMLSGAAKVTVTDGRGVSSSATTPVTVFDPMTVDAQATSATKGDVGLSVDFSATAAGGDTNYTYTWHFGDGGTATGATASHTYAASGNYNAYVVATDTASHSATSTAIPVTIWSPLTVSLTGTPTSGTLPLPVTFNAVAQGGDGHYTYSYDYGDGATGSDANHTYNAAGTYTAKVTVTDTASHTVTSTGVAITVWAPLSANIAASATTGTTPFSVDFTSNVAGGDGSYTYAWNFGDGTTANTANPTKVFNNAGNFSVTLTVTDGSSHTVLSNTINMTVYAPLTVSASATPTNLTVGDSTTFTAVASGGDGHYSYAWVFGDGSTGTGATANHVYTTYHAGDFTWMAHVTVTDTAGHSVTSGNIAIVVKPVPPTITYAKKVTNPFRIVLFGTNFQAGCTATINGVPVEVKYKNGGKIKLKHCKSLCPKGVPVNIVVTNPDGGVSAPFQFAR